MMIALEHNSKKMRLRLDAQNLKNPDLEDDFVGSKFTAQVIAYLIKDYGLDDKLAHQELCIEQLKMLRRTIDRQIRKIEGGFYEYR